MPTGPGAASAPEPAARLDNGLIAASYIALADIDAATAAALLDALRRVQIAAYLIPTESVARTSPGSDATPPSRRCRLYVDTTERGDARTVVASALRALGVDAPGDPLDSVDTDAEFAAIVADWHVDTVRAIREAERELTNEDEHWRARLLPQPEGDAATRAGDASDDGAVWIEDEHYIPPAPPPLPRLAAPTVLAVSILVISVLVLGIGGQVGLANSLTLVLGVGGVLLAAGMLIMRLRPDDRDADGDGSAI